MKTSLRIFLFILMLQCADKRICEARGYEHLAEELQQQQEGSMIRNPYWGISFNAPQGWKMTKEESRYFFSTTDEDQLIIVLQHSMHTFQEIIDDYQLSQGASDQDQIVPAGPYEKLGPSSLGYPIAGMFSNTFVEGYVALGINSGSSKGISVLAVASNGKFSPPLRQIAVNTLASVRYFPSEQSPAVPEWKKRLNGSRLIRMSTYNGGDRGGMSSSTRIDLCGNGYFSYSDDSSVSIYVDGASANSNSQQDGDGSWDIASNGDGALLRLNFNDGRSFEYTLTYQNDKVFLNGTRYLRAYEGDQYGNGPDCH